MRRIQSKEDTTFNYYKLSSANPFDSKLCIHKSSLEQVLYNKNKSDLLNFVTDGIEFDHQVINSKAAHSLPYSQNAYKDIFKNKLSLEIGRIVKHYKNYKRYYDSKYLRKNDLAYKKRPNKAMLEVNEDSPVNEDMRTGKSTNVRQINDSYFDYQKLTLSENFEEDIPILITNDKCEKHDILTIESNAERSREFDETRNIDTDIIKWDEHLIRLLSENTARWVVMKITDDSKQKQKLLEIVETKYGRYTRDIKDLELIEDSLTDFEKRKIAEEKLRLANDELKKSNDIEVNNNTSSKDAEIPLYRLPQGIKRIILNERRQPDKNFNKSANVQLDACKIKSPTTFQLKMEKKKVTDLTLYKSQHPFQVELLSNNKVHKPPKDENIIVLETGKSFRKNIQSVFPSDFTEWVPSASSHEKATLVKYTKGQKKWKTLPELINNDVMNKPEVSNNIFYYMPPTTPDTELRKILKSNVTVAHIIDLWRHNWQTKNKWSLAEIHELIADMRNERASTRLQALVVSSRAAEQIQMLIDKIKNHNRNNNDQKDSLFYKASLSEPNDYFYDMFFTGELFEAIESLLDDKNNRVQLAAAIAIFTILRKFSRPLLERHQAGKDNAESVLRKSLQNHARLEKYAAALCLAFDGRCEEVIIDELLLNYFNSNEQVTKEQVTESMALLSSNYPIVIDMIETYLKSELARHRILACKLFPCLRRSIPKNVCDKLIQLMWNDINRKVKKVAAQTLGRTGKGKEVHNEIYNRLKSQNIFERIEALRKISQIGIMTPKLLTLYLKCFRDDYISVRKLACKSSQYLYHKDKTIIDALVFMAEYDSCTKLKSLAIQTLGLIGSFNFEIRKCLVWALQFELDPLVRTEAVHSLILLNRDNKDAELINLLVERHLIENQKIVRKEIVYALEYLGFDTSQEIPIVTKIKEDVIKLNSKEAIINNIKQFEHSLNFESDKMHYIWPATKDLTKVDQMNAPVFSANSGK